MQSNLKKTGLLFAVVAAGCSAAPPVNAPEPASLPSACQRTIAAEDTLFSAPFEVKDGRIYVGIMVNGEGPFPFAIDTGAGGQGRADLSLVAALGLSFMGDGEASDGVNSQTVPTVLLKEIDIGGFVRSDIEVMSRDYSSRMPADQKISGILGRGFFEEGTLLIDYPQKTVTFTRKSILEAAAQDTLPFDRPFRVPVKVGDTVVEANLDTGANIEVVMPLDLYEQFVGTELASAGDASLTNTKLSTQQGELHGPFRLGAVEFTDAPVRVSDRFPEMMIGARILQNYRILIDQKSRGIAICP